MFFCNAKKQMKQSPSPKEQPCLGQSAGIQGVSQFFQVLKRLQFFCSNFFLLACFKFCNKYGTLSFDIVTIALHY